MSNQKIPDFIVHLSSTHPDYQQVGFRRPQGYPNYSVVEVDLGKFIYYCEASSDIEMAPQVTGWSKEKKEGLMKFLSPPGVRENYPEIPIVSFNIRKVIKIEKKFIFLKRKTEIIEKFVSFTNGRHRTRYLEFAGAKTMWVLCPDIYSADLIKYCGV